MCRMLVAVGNVDPDSLIDGMILMAKDVNSIHELNEKRGKGTWKHGDGWGIAYLDENDEWVVKKSTRAIYDDPEVKKFRKIKAKLFIIHTRYKMGSEVDINNTHPFIFDREKQGNILFCHNGFIEEDIYYDKKFKTLGDTDSEQLFYSILTDLRKSNIVKAVRKNFKRYKKLKGTNIIMSTKKETVVAMRENKFPKYYQMSLGRTKDMIVVSSEQFRNSTGIFWEPLQQGDIIKINNKNLKIKVNKERKKPLLKRLHLSKNKNTNNDKTNKLVAYSHG